MICLHHELTLSGEMMVEDCSFDQRQEMYLQTLGELYSQDTSGTSKESPNITGTRSPEQRETVLMDITNEQAGVKRKMSISGVLKCSETPKRKRDHRNYRRKFYPVLTAGERLDEIRQIEEEKQNVIQQRKEKAEKRAERKMENEKLRAETRELIKKKAEKRAEEKIEAEKLKAVMRERRLKESAIRKQERENLRKEKRANATAHNRQQIKKVNLFKNLNLTSASKTSML